MASLDGMWRPPVPPSEKQDRYKGDLIERLNDGSKYVRPAECYGFFRANLKLLKRDEQNGNFDPDYFEYVMSLMKLATGKGFTSALLLEYREFINRHGWNL